MGIRKAPAVVVDAFDIKLIIIYITFRIFTKHQPQEFHNPHHLLHQLDSLQD